MTKLVSVRKLLNGPPVKSTGSPVHRGNSASIWPITINGEEIIKTNPIGCTLDAMSVRAVHTLDRVGIDRSTAMRFGLSFYAWLYGGWDVFPDIIFKLNKLVKDDRVVGSLKGIVTSLFERVMSLAPPES